MKIKLEYDSSEFTTKLNQILKAGLDWTDPFTEIAASFRRSRRAIKRLKGPGQYKDLAPSTKKQKLRKYGFIYPPLVATGKMLNSIIQKGHPDNITIIKPNYLEIGSRVEYLKYHESDEGRKVIPLRKVLFWGPEAPRFAKGELAGLPGIVLKTLKGHFLRRVGVEPEEIGKVLEQEFGP